MKTVTNIVILCFVFLFHIENLTAQIYTVDQGGSTNTCSGNFFDSGNSAVNYQDNESFTITFCSNGGGNVVSVDFATLFDINSSDTLFVYDGNTTSTNLIGAFNNNNVPTIVNTTTSNTSGCVTFEFISDGSLTGQGWEAIISCITACQPINPVITTVPALMNFGPDSTYTDICPGDNVLFNVTTTYPDNGANPNNYVQSDATSTFSWSLGTGNIANTQTANEIYPSPQGYLATLTITDANNCIETISHRIRTGVPPNFTGLLIQPDTACFGDTINLFGGFNQTTTIPPGAVPNQGMISAGGINTGQTFLPDGSGASYSTTINISGFNGQTIQNGTDIQEVCMNIEHSFLGDLTLELECPNGTRIDLSNTFGTSPGSTFLGDANDALPPSIVPGNGLDYCFSLGAGFGTMASENSAANWIPSVFSPNNNILTPGGYQPDDSFNNLIGCPIDGDWELIITDNQSGDNGYIFQWNILIDSDVNPNDENYSVDIIDGVWLTNPDIINDFDTLAIAVPTTSGTRSFVFETTDSYGCTFDTTLQVVVLPEIIPVAISDTVLCLNMTARLDVNTAVPAGTSLNYLWSPATDLTDPTISDPTFNGLTTNTYTVAVSYQDFPQCSDTSAPITIEVRSDPAPELLGDTTICFGNLVELSITNSDSIIWNDGSTASSVSFTPDNDTLISATVVNFCNTFIFNQNITVNPNPILTASPDTGIIVTDTARLFAFPSDSTVSYSWSPLDGLDCFNCQDPLASPTETTLYNIIVTDSNGCVDDTTILVDVFIPDLFIPSGFSPNGDGINDVVFVRSLDIKTMSFQVFDRWGGRIFESNDQENGWDGTSNGKEVDLGVYFYKFEAQFLNGRRMAQSGSITLYR